MKCLLLHKQFYWEETLELDLEDNLYLSKGKLATNAQLVEKAIRIIDEIGYTPMTPAETREKLKLIKHN